MSIPRQLTEIVVDAIWEGFEAEDSACVDREMDLIDTGGHYETFSMQRVAENVLKRLAENKIISTVDDLDALPIPELDDLAGVLIKSTCLVDPDNGNYGLGEIYERNSDGTWCQMVTPAGVGEERIPSKDIPLPAVILYVPRV